MRARRALGTSLGLGGGLAAGAWVAYAWLPHLLPGAAIRRGSPEGRRIALTFDDGPDPVWTPRILAVLAAHDARGTFFVVGERAARWPDVVRDAARAGHEIGNHGWSHTSLWRCGPARTGEEIDRCQALVTDLAGTPPRLFRPPWGMLNAAMFAAVRQHGARCLLWSIQPEGLRPRAPRDQVAHVLSRARPGAIVDLHDADGLPDAGERLAAALPAMLAGLRAAGYTLVTASELLEDAPPGV